MSATIPQPASPTGIGHYPPTRNILKINCGKLRTASTYEIYAYLVYQVRRKFFFFWIFVNVCVCITQRTKLSINHAIDRTLLRRVFSPTNERIFSSSFPYRLYSSSYFLSPCCYWCCCTTTVVVHHIRGHIAPSPPPPPSPQLRFVPCTFLWREDVRAFSRPVFSPSLRTPVEFEHFFQVSHVLDIARVRTRDHRLLAEAPQTPNTPATLAYIQTYIRNYTPKKRLQSA